MLGIKPMMCPIYMSNTFHKWQLMYLNIVFNKNVFENIVAFIKELSSCKHIASRHKIAKLESENEHMHAISIINSTQNPSQAISIMN